MPEARVDPALKTVQSAFFDQIEAELAKPKTRLVLP